MKNSDEKLVFICVQAKIDIAVKSTHIPMTILRPWVERIAGASVLWRNFSKPEAYAV